MTDMKAYKLVTVGAVTLKLTEDGIKSGATLGSMLGVKGHGGVAREDALAVTVEGTRKTGIGRTATFGVIGALVKVKHVNVSVHLADGSVRTYKINKGSAVEIATAFAVRGWPVGDDVAVSVPAEDSTKARFAKLDELHDAGVITTAELAAKRAEIISEL
jgi:hypothetical protein